jgi:electron transfer flavoprotein beta subunit
MKILVCIKQVPDMESKFKLNAAGTWYEETDLAWRMNEYDEYAVEQAVQVREQVGEADLTVLSIGPGRVRETLKKALAMGCDRGVHIEDDAVHERDPFAIASIIAEFARGQGFDLILTGMQSQDRGSGQVGVLLAELLGLPSITTVVEFAWDGGSVTARRELEGGLRAVVNVAAPALVTCQLGLNAPRYPTLPNIMKAKRKELDGLKVAELLKVELQLATAALRFPEKKGGAQLLEGDAPELADRLIGLLQQKTGVF